MKNRSGILFGVLLFSLGLASEARAVTVRWEAASGSLSETGSVTLWATINSTYSSSVSFAISRSGSAAYGTDYSLSSSSLVFAAGSRRASIVVRGLSDSLAENNETIVLSVAALHQSPPSVHTTTLTNSGSAPAPEPAPAPVLPSVQFSSASQTIAEGAGTASMVINLSAASASSISVPYTVSGSASNPADHNLANGTLTFAAGSTSRNLSFSLVNDTLVENAESVIVTLGAPSGATLGSIAIHTITLTSEDVAAPVPGPAPAPAPIGDAYFAPPAFQEWTEFPSSSYSNFIYVSNAGSDANAGTSSSAPVATFATALTRARAVGAHGILLARGSSWSTGLVANIAGRSRSLKFLVGAYGSLSSPRPRIHYVGSTGAIVIAANNVAVVDLHLEGLGKFNDPDSFGLTTSAGVRGVLLEGCYLTGHKTGIRVENSGDISIRRNIITQGRRHGIITSGITNADGEYFLVEENFFHANGTDPVFDQQIYKASDTDRVVIRRNIFGQGGNHSVKWRSGASYGDVSENIFINGRNPINAKADHENPNNRGSDYLSIRDNVFMKTIGSDPSPTEASIFLKNVRHGRVVRNYMVDMKNPGGNYNIVLSSEQVVIDSGRGTTPGLIDVTVSNNIIANTVNQGVSIRSASLSELQDVRISNNLFSLDTAGTVSSKRCVDSMASPEISFDLNRYFSIGSNWFRMGGTAYTFSAWRSSVEPDAMQGQSVFVDSTRTIERYNREMAGGSASMDAFFAEVLRQSKENWRVQYTAPAVGRYFKDGFEVIQ